VKAGGDLLAVALVVQLEQAIQQLDPRDLADREAPALPGLVEAVAQIEIVPAISGEHREVELDVQVAQRLNARIAVVRVVEAVVGRRQALLVGLHQGRAVGVVALADRLEGGEVAREGERLEAVGWGVSRIAFECCAITKRPGGVNIRDQRREPAERRHDKHGKCLVNHKSVLKKHE
jgi:hypothetical protein